VNICQSTVFTLAFALICTKFSCFTLCIFLGHLSCLNPVLSPLFQVLVCSDVAPSRLATQLGQVLHPWYFYHFYRHFSRCWSVPMVRHHDWLHSLAWFHVPQTAPAPGPTLREGLTNSKQMALSSIIKKCYQVSVSDDEYTCMFLYKQDHVQWGSCLFLWRGNTFPIKILDITASLSESHYTCM
jgi:hypothetical protein